MMDEKADDGNNDHELRIFGPESLTRSFRSIVNLAFTLLSVSDILANNGLRSRILGFREASLYTRAKIIAMWRSLYTQ